MGAAPLVRIPEIFLEHVVLQQGSRAVFLAELGSLPGTADIWLWRDSTAHAAAIQCHLLNVLQMFVPKQKMSSAKEAD